MPRQPYRISFKKKKRVAFGKNDNWAINVNGAAVGGLAWPIFNDGEGGYSWGVDAALGLSWFNTWEKNLAFKSVEEAQADCRTRLHAALTAAGVDQRKPKPAPAPERT